ncbi:hypothetical protein JX266_007079 [Neoarthrinium moseri]|nr:hypothetical protein JX266_007079 [Neoarthrinium moseri]
MSESRTPGERPHIILLATCDTKMEEITFVHNRLSTLNPDSRLTLIDIGRTAVSNPLIIVSPDHLVRTISSKPPPDLASQTRAAYSKTITSAATSYIHAQLGNPRTSSQTSGQDENDSRSHHPPVHGIIGIGGSTGSSIVAAVMRAAVPIGVPKLLVSTMASGDVGHLVGGVDLTLMYSVVDIAGLNFLSERVLGNAAAAMAGMARAYASSTTTTTGSSPSQADGAPRQQRKQRIALTMFGVTTPGADRIRALLTRAPHGAEVVVFHATGAGGRAMEALVAAGEFDAVVDLTTTEVADEVGGGVLSAGPDRLAAAGAAGLPLVLSVGACDMVNFGPRPSVPAALAREAEAGRRTLHEHNAAVTLLRTSADESRRVAAFMVEKLRASRRPDRVRVLLPTEGISMISGKGGPFEDRAADEALFRGLEEGLEGSGIRVERHAVEINDPVFAEKVVEALVGLQSIS